MVTYEATTVGKNNILHWNQILHIGGFRGVGGSFSHFRTVFGKSGQIIGWCPLFRAGASRLGNPGCAAAVSAHFGKIARKMLH